MEEQTNINESNAVETSKSETPYQFQVYLQNTRRPLAPPVKLEIARNRLNDIDEFIGRACDDVYSRLVEDSFSRKRKVR